jgi:hypothetical protein
MRGIDSRFAADERSSVSSAGVAVNAKGMRGTQT